MTRGELLLELLSEEIPARMQRRAIDDLDGACSATSSPPRRSRPRACAAMSRRAASRSSPTASPRRSRTAPRSGADRASARRSRRSTDFCAPPGSPRSSECEIRDTGRGEFYFAVVKRPGPARRARCCRSCYRAAIAELPWPKSMRYPASSSALGAAADLGRLPVRRRGSAAAARPGAGRADDARTPLSVRGRDLGRQRGRLSRSLEDAHVVLDQDRRSETDRGRISTARRGRGARRQARSRRCSTRSRG